MSQQLPQPQLLTTKTRTEADAIVETVERLLTPQLIEAKEQGGEAVPILLGPKGLEVFDLAEHLDPVRKAPRRRKGTAVLGDLASFIAHAKRFSDEGSALFADTTGGCSLMCVHDYHPPGAESAPRFGEHRSLYRFPFSDEWTQWTQKNGSQLSQAAFAEFVETRALDFLDPAEASARAKEIATTLGVSYAPPIKMLDASRGLSLHQNSRVKQAQNLATGEVTFVYETQHAAIEGGPSKIPAAFLIAIPVFRSGPLYQLAARLRYRLRDGVVTWFYELFGADRVLEHAFDEACVTAQTETELPLFRGVPE